MKQTVYFDDFYDAFRNIRPDNFSDNGLYALFNYLEDLERETGEELELDVVALCCDYSEYKTIEEAEEDLGDNLNIIAEFDGGIIVENN